MLKNTLKVLFFGFILSLFGGGGSFVGKKAVNTKEPIPTKNDNVLDYKSFIQDIVKEHDHGLIRDAFAACFPAGTLVAVTGNREGEFATKRIEDILSGEAVLTVNFESGKVEKNLVSRHASHEIRMYPMIEILTESGNKFIATENHAVIINDKNVGIPAKDLAPGQKILVAGSEPKWERVASIWKYAAAVPVYNVEVVREPHNFLVSVEGSAFVAVHNGCCCK